MDLEKGVWTRQEGRALAISFHSLGGDSAKRGNLFMAMSTGFGIRDLTLNPDPGTYQLGDAGIVISFH